jgi:HlyD family secretion protein
VNYGLRMTNDELKTVRLVFRHSSFVIRHLSFVLICLLLLQSAACSYVAKIAGLQNQEVRIPTIRVVRGPVETSIYTMGELRPGRTSTIIAPPIAGGLLQIIHLAKTGTRVKQGDIVVEFDPSEQEYSLEQSKSQLEEADQASIKLKADQAVRAAQDRVNLLRAQYNVRRAEFKVQGNDLLGEIEAKKNVIDLEEAKRKFEQLQRDVKSRASSDAAEQAVQNVARMKATMGIKMAEQNLQNLVWKAPTDGVVILGQNLEALMSGSGSIRIISGMIPEFKEGDQVYPGRLVAQIQDMGQLEIQSKVLETDRGNVDVGQPIDIWMDSTPLKSCTGKVKSLATAASDVTSANTTLDLLDALSTRSFDTTFEVNPTAEQMFLGVSARVTVKGNTMKDVLSIPRQALFQKNTKQVVYLRRADGWEAQEIRVKYLTESRVVIEGLAEQTEVALVNPELQKSKAAAKKGVLASFLGGSAQ